MTWNDKADDIAAKLLKSMKGYEQEDIRNALRQAALLGMQFDSINWCRKSR